MPIVLVILMRRLMPSHLRIFALLIAVACPAVASAQDVVGFQSPSGNIHCNYFKGDTARETTIRCDVMEMVVTARRPKDCELEWGRAFEIAADGRRGERICYGDTVMDRALPKLSYGEVWQRGGFTCKSEPSGIACFNADRHGFSVSRGTQTLF